MGLRFQFGTNPKFDLFLQSDSNSANPNLEFTLIMASKKKHSEGIALLSVYSDEDDEEMEDAEEEEEAERTKEGQQEEANFMNEEKKRGQEDSGTPKVVIDGGASSAHATPRSLDNDEPDWSSPMNFESERALDDTSGESNDTLLDQFLPPRPKDKCSEDLQVSSPIGTSNVTILNNHVRCF